MPSIYLSAPGVQGVDPVMREGHQRGHGRLGAQHALAHGELLSCLCGYIDKSVDRSMGPIGPTLEQQQFDAIQCTWKPCSLNRSSSYGSCLMRGCVKIRRRGASSACGLCITFSPLSCIHTHINHGRTSQPLSGPTASRTRQAPVPFPAGRRSRRRGVDPGEPREGWAMARMVGVWSCAHIRSRSSSRNFCRGVVCVR